VRTLKLTAGIALLGLGVPFSPAQGGCINYADYIHRLSQLTLPSPGQGLAIQGEYAYVASYDSGLRVVDIADEQVMCLVGSTAVPGLTGGVTVQESHAFVTGAIFEQE
jgi:hypothetical protein